MGWLFDRQVGRPGAFEDFVDVHRSLAKQIGIPRGVCHQPAFLGEPARHGNRPHTVLERQFGSAPARQAGLNDDSVGSVLVHRSESGLELVRLLILIGLIVVPVTSPPSWICSRNGFENGSVAFASAVTRRAEDGSISRISCMLLPASSAATVVIPVTFPPGRRRLATNPRPTGSPVSAMTIGISRVACLAATAVGVNQVTMISTLRRTSSAANSGSRLICPSADRNSNRMFCPSIYPRSCSPCRITRQNCSGLILPMTSAPMVGTFGCCARAASGHATAAPPTVAMNSRRPMWFAMRPSRGGHARQWRDDTTLAWSVATSRELKTYGNSACCARAASGHAAAAPPSSVMNLRRFMSSIGDFLPIAADWPVRPVFRRFSLPQGGRQVLGAELKCSESKRGGLPLMCL